LVASLGSNIDRPPELGRKDSSNLIKRTVQVVSEGIRWDGRISLLDGEWT